MESPGGIAIVPGLIVPDHEVRLSASRSGGPGGQHVNTTSTRVELRWSIASSQALTERQRALLTERLAHRLDRTGSLRIVASEHRSQLRNREAAVRRFRGVVAAGLREPTPRRPTKPSRAVRERRLAEKKRQSEKKRERRKVDE